MVEQGLMIHRRVQDRNVRERQGGKVPSLILFRKGGASMDGIMEITECSEQIGRPDLWRLLFSLSRACLESSLRIPGKTKVLAGRGAYSRWTGKPPETRGDGVGTARLWSPNGPVDASGKLQTQTLC